VLLLATDEHGTVVERTEVPYDDYYGGGVAIVDSNAYRAAKRIRRLTGEVYNSKGQLQQSFDNQYAEDGRYLRSRMIFADGTVVEN
jgi:hypothetical protein